MQTTLTILALLLLALSAVSIVIAGWTWRRIWLSASIVSAIFAAVIGVKVETIEIERKDIFAKDLGFPSHEQYDAAKARGIHSYDEWKRTVMEESAAKSAAAKAQKLAEEERCARDVKCQHDKGLIPATVECRAPIERLAKWNFEWTDKWYQEKFSHYRSKERAPGIVTYIGDRIKFQNGFGAWQIYIYECDFDVRNETVIAVRARPGQLAH